MTITIPGAVADTDGGRPAITIWSRLEPNPSGDDYGEALQAALADPLWLLARQWQFGEFEGEDAGTPIEVRGTGAYFPIEACAPGRAAPPRAYDGSATPPEALVAAEDPALSGPFEGARAGRHFLRMAEQANLADAFRNAPALTLELAIPEAGRTHESSRHWVRLLDRATIDGHKLATAIAAAGGIPAGVAVPAAKAAEARMLCLAWLHWYRGSIPGPFGEAWLPDRMESRFSLEAHDGAAPVGLVCEQFADGRLDWYHFDAAAPRPAATARAPASLAVGPVIPTPIQFPGGPAARFWEFEDGRVNLADVEAGPTDLGRMVMLEFALSFGDDWFVLPATLEAGGLARLDELAVTDTFGIVSKSRAVQSADWRMYGLSGVHEAQGLFFLAPTVQGRNTGDPVEEVSIALDELANMAWAVEQRVPDPIGLPVARAEAAILGELIDGPSVQKAAREFSYRIASPIPDGWFAMTLDRRTEGGTGAGEFRLRLPGRADANGARANVGPAGTILQPYLAGSTQHQPAAIKSEEIAGIGTRISRLPHSARSANGETIFWTGRNKGICRVKVPIKLEFDLAQAIESPVGDSIP